MGMSLVILGGKSLCLIDRGLFANWLMQCESIGDLQCLGRSSKRA